MSTQGHIFISTTEDRPMDGPEIIVLCKSPNAKPKYWYWDGPVTCQECLKIKRGIKRES
jgi:hypothetical protein